MGSCPDTPANNELHALKQVFTFISVFLIFCCQLGIITSLLSIVLCTAGKNLE